jgi:hypothetical protein
MHRHEEQLWSNLADRGLALPDEGNPAIGPAGAATGNGAAAGTGTAGGSVEATRVTSSRSTRKKTARVTRRMMTRKAKSPSHLGN